MLNLNINTVFTNRLSVKLSIQAEVSADNDSSILLTWTFTGNPDGFEIERSTDGGSNWTLVQSPTSEETSWEDTSVVTGNTYDYRIRATKGDKLSAWSQGSFELLA
jgi:fibronectin type 3 domain-containing protein